MKLEGGPESPERTAAILRDLEDLEGGPCSACGGLRCGHENVMSVVLGFKSQPRCLGCLAAGVGRDRDGLRDQLLEYILRHECFRTGWSAAGLREGRGAADRPACLWSAGGAAPGPDPHACCSTTFAASMEPDEQWDAGDMGCGDLVLQLRMRMELLGPGRIFRLVARDRGAPEDIPAWCRLIGHTLIAADHPVYTIRRKEG